MLAPGREIYATALGTDSQEVVGWGPGVQRNRLTSSAIVIWSPDGYAAQGQVLKTLIGVKAETLRKCETQV